jgi:hypothetical protein
MIRKFCRNLLLRGLILAFTGDHAADAFEEPQEQEEETAPSAAATALQALDHLDSGLDGLLPVAAYEVVRGAGF